MQVKLKRLHEWNDVLRMFVRKFLTMSNECERDEEQVVLQLKRAVRDPEAGVWLIMAGAAALGYIFVEVLPTDHNTTCIMVQQMYMSPGTPFKFYGRLADALFAFGASRGASEIYFLTRRDPNAFIRLLNDGWQIDSFVLRKKKKIALHGTNGHASTFV